MRNITSSVLWSASPPVALKLEALNFARPVAVSLKPMLIIAVAATQLQTVAPDQMLTKSRFDLTESKPIRQQGYSTWHG